MVWTVRAASEFDGMSAYFDHQGWEVTTDRGWDRTTYVDLGWEIDGRPAPDDDSQAGFLTRQLRDSDDPLFARTRELVSGYGIDVGSVRLAQLLTDDVGVEFGVLVAPGPKAFTFVLRHGNVGAPDSRLRTAKIARWSDISDVWESSPYRRCVRETMAVPIGVGA